MDLGHGFFHQFVLLEQKPLFSQRFQLSPLSEQQHCFNKPQATQGISLFRSHLL